MEMFILEIVKVLGGGFLIFYILKLITKAYVYRPDKITKKMWKAIEAGIEYRLKIRADGTASITSEALWKIYKQEYSELKPNQARIVDQQIKKYTTVEQYKTIIA